MSVIFKKLSCLLAACLLLFFCGCERKQGSYRYTYLDVFDTVTGVTVCASSQAEADELAALLHEELLTCHRLFDIYHEYDALVNLCTVNRLAGQEAVTVDGRILDLLVFAQEMGEASGGKLNVCMGSLLSLWHEARTAANEHPELAALPEQESIREAMEHMSPSALQLDETASTVRFLDPEMQLDVGAVAKGWAVQRACELAKGKGYGGFLISAGGNVCSVGPKGDGSQWKIALERPDGSGSTLMVTQLSDCAAVTSGSYQRYFEVEGERYCHIVDPDMGEPARYYEMVTVICPDSAVGDALSTALFLLPQEEGAELAAAFGADVLWYSDGSYVTTPGFPLPAD
jgi:thiamine biosynthesis lipoprotein